MPCACVFLSWLVCHYCGRDWEQRERLPSSAGTTCSHEWHSVWLLLSWNGNEYVQVCNALVTSYQERSCIGNDYVQIIIVMLPTYQNSHVGNEHVWLCAIVKTSYHELSHSCNTVGLVFTLYLVYLLSHLPTSLMWKFFIISSTTSVV